MTMSAKRKRVDDSNIASTKKIVLNKCVGGFGLSELATHALMERLGCTSYDEREARRVLDMIDRDHPILVQVVEEFGQHAWFPSSGSVDDWIHKPIVVEIPNVEFEIVWNHGFEHAVPISFERPLGSCEGDHGSSWEPQPQRLQG